MAVIPLESFPVGYRFHPTDVELVNHYLKRKINGRIRSDIEVIPEIDVCKCEPWDLPDKALIRSDDPEWFFFSPKDRKYPNGHRLNRATEAGYWKATGKDRTIRTKAPLMPAVIGMKKTLVFHRGRAPKGVRTNWIMHEYRATEPEFEYGEQGGYVLYRLFRKAEEKSPGCSGDEVGQQSLSPTPTKSSPCDPQHDTDAFEDFGTPIMAEPLNQVSPFSDILENPQSLLGKENPPSGITRWLADKDDRSSLKPPDEHCNDHVAVEQEAEAGTVMDPLGDALGQLCDPKYEHNNSNSFPIITSPLRSYNSNPLLGSTDQGSHMGFDRVDDNNENNSMDEFWNSILSNQDEYSGGLNVQQMSTPEVIHSRSSSEVDTEAGIVLGDLGLHDPGWFGMDTPSALYENASLLPYANNGPDVYSVDSGTESLQELFNSMRESNGHMNAFNNEVSLREEAGITGIKTRTAHPRHPTLDNLSTEQGLARRRIRLQVGSICRIQFDSGTTKEENGGGQRNIEVKDTKESDSPIMLNDIPIHDNIVASLNIEEPRPSKTELKLRTRSTKETTKFDEVRGPVLGRGTSKSGVAVGYVIWLIALMTILVLLCVGIWKWRRSKSLWISGILDYFP